MELEELNERLHRIHSQSGSLEFGGILLKESRIGIKSKGIESGDMLLHESCIGNRFRGTKYGDVSLNESGVGEGSKSGVSSIFESCFADLSDQMVELPLSTLVTEDSTENILPNVISNPIINEYNCLPLHAGDI